MDLISRFADHHGIHAEPVAESLVILAGAFFLISYLNKFLRRVGLKGKLPSYFSYETILFVTRLITIGMWIGAAMLLLNFWGVSVTGLWTVLVSMAAVVGVGFLAVWTMVSNITASVFLTIWRPFHMGASVEMLPEGMKGKVVDRNLMFTVLHEVSSDSVLFVPNNLFFQKVFRVSDPGAQHRFEPFADESSATSTTLSPATLPVRNPI